MEYRREIALVYSVEEATKKLNNMRGHGFSESEIHLFAKDIHPLQSLKMYTDIQIHQAGRLLNQLYSLLTRKNVYEISLRNLRLSDEEIKHYGHGIELGGIFIIAQHEYPFEKQPKKKVSDGMFRKLQINNLLALSKLAGHSIFRKIHR